jgi:hypothetical protein
MDTISRKARKGRQNETTIPNSKQFQMIKIPSAAAPQPNRNVSRKGAKAAKKKACHFDQREKSFLDR